MNPFLVPIGLTIAIVGAFWPTAKEGKAHDNGKNDSDSSTRDSGGKPRARAASSDGRKSGVKSSVSKPSKAKEKDHEQISTDTPPTGDVRGNQSGDDCGGEPDTPQGCGDAEPVTESPDEIDPADLITEENEHA